MHKSSCFSTRIEGFEALEAMAAPADRAILARLPGHEVAAIAFLERERAGDEDSVVPLRAFLADAATYPGALDFPLTSARAVPFHHFRQLAVRSTIATCRVLDRLGL